MKTRGFTLIELLVVISIIGILSSVDLVALASARKQANESAILQEMTQFRNLYELAYNDTGGYSSLQTRKIEGRCNSFFGTTGFYCSLLSEPNCDSVFGTSGTIANNPTANSICKNIVDNSGFFYIGVNTNTNMDQKYSIAALLPSKGQYICMGSSKSNSLVATVHYNPLENNPDTSPGCSANP